MRSFANLLQILLIANGTLSLLVGFFFVDSQGRILETLYVIFGSLVVILAILFLPFLGLNRNLPKRVFLPQIFLLFWVFSGLWPLAQEIGQLQAHMLAAIGQVLLGLFALFYNHILNRKSLLLTPEMFSAPGFSLSNFLGVGVGSLLLLPVCVIFFGFSLATSYVDRLSGGFVRLDVDGLYMTERTYGLQDKTIRLTSMIHIGDQRYYDELAQSFSVGRTLVLAEGVSDQDGLLQQTFSYGEIADFLGLASQEEMQFGGRLIAVERLAEADFRGAEDGLPDIARADVDLRDFAPETLEFINALGRYLLSNSSLADGFENFNRWAQDNMTPESNDIIMNDLVTKRNRAVIGHLAFALKKYDMIVIPWGALHMVGIEEAILNKGFLLQDSRERRSIDFSKIPYAELMESLKASSSQTEE